MVGVVKAIAGRGEGWSKQCGDRGIGEEEEGAGVSAGIYKEIDHP